MFPVRCNFAVVVICCITFGLLTVISWSKNTFFSVLFRLFLRDVENSDEPSMFYLFHIRT